MYKVIACGVNTGPGAKTLRFAEKDAKDVADIFRSGLGPVQDDDVSLFRGSSATSGKIQSALLNLADARPSHLLFYFSGHGNQQGVLTADGILPYHRIIRCLETIDVPYSMVVLDVCSAASYLGFLKKAHLEGIAGELELSWLDALAQATPGNRLMFSTGSGRSTAGEGALGIKNGNFTFAFLEALRHGAGDINIEGREWISDQRAFVIASRIMKSSLKVRAEPVERNLTGDYPLTLSQATEPVGGAFFSNASITPGSLDVHFKIRERKLVDTQLKWSIVNIQGRVIAAGSLPLKPGYDNAVYSHSLPCPHDKIKSDLVSQLHLIRQKRAPIDWILVLEDGKGRVLARKVVPTVWRRT